MNRLASPLAVLFAAIALGTSGCIFLTPPTGLRLGNHANEYPQLTGNAGGVTSSQTLVYTQPDFAVLFPDAWNDRQPLNEVSEDGTQILRGLFRGLLPNNEVEGLAVTTYMQSFDKDPAKNLAGLGSAIAANLKDTFRDGAMLDTTPIKLDGENALRIEISGTAKDVQGQDGQVITGTPRHYVSYCAYHLGRGLELFYFTSESFWSSRQPFFDQAAAEVKWGNVPPNVCIVPIASAAADPAATGARSGFHALAVSGRSLAQASPAATGTITPAASDAAASMSPVPATLVLCFPDASPAATAAASATP